MNRSGELVSKIYSALFRALSPFSLRLFLVTLIILTNALSSCKKYEEGPLISFRSIPERLANHWKPEKKIIDGEEVSLTDEEQRTVHTFDKGGVYIKRVPNGPYYSSYNGSWEFFDKKEKLKTRLNYTNFGNPIVEEQEYEIIKLKEKSLWLRSTDSAGIEEEIHFIPE